MNLLLILLNSIISIACYKAGEYAYNAYKKSCRAAQRKNSEYVTVSIQVHKYIKDDIDTAAEAIESLYTEAFPWEDKIHGGSGKKVTRSAFIRAGIARQLEEYYAFDQVHTHLENEGFGKETLRHEVVKFVESYVDAEDEYKKQVANAKEHLDNRVSMKEFYERTAPKNNAGNSQVASQEAKNDRCGT